jgi:predicted transcriptional regulator
MKLVEGLLKRIADWFKRRSIKDVSSWDGAASNYPDAASYCKACLIDANAAAGKSGVDVIEANCKLPVREAGDAAGVYVRQAVHAAAGGHGITQVSKPADVPDDKWAALVKAAARELVAAYKEMEEIAPDAVYELAGLAKPERVVTRAESLNYAIGDALEQLGPDAWFIDLYLSQDKVLLLYNQEGKLYTIAIAEDPEGGIVLGDPLEVIVKEHTPSRLSVTRQADGQYRWFAIACSAVVDKQGEIDSKALFDDFVNRWQAGEPFVLRFFHDSRLDLGVGDWLAREDNLLLASGRIDDSELGKAFVEASTAKRGEWGTSIGFYAMAEPEILRTEEGIEIPIYKQGKLMEVSILPEQDACAFYTRITAELKERTMDERKRKALIDLFGDEALADGFIATVDETNRTIVEAGLLTRETTTEETETVTTEEVTETPPEATTTSEPVIETAPAINDEVIRRLDELAGKVDQSLAYAVRIEALESGFATLQQVVEKLNLSDEEKRQIWLADRPAGESKPPVTYRPRTDRRSEQEGTKFNSADVAAATLSRMNN